MHALKQSSSDMFSIRRIRSLELRSHALFTDVPYDDAQFGAYEGTDGGILGGITGGAIGTLLRAKTYRLSI